MQNRKIKPSQELRDGCRQKGGGIEAHSDIIIFESLFQINSDRHNDKIFLYFSKRTASPVSPNPAIPQA